MKINKIPTDGKVEVYTVENFLTDWQCDHLTKIIMGNHERASIIVGENNNKVKFEKRLNKHSVESKVRTNSACHQLQWDPIALMYDAKLCKLMGISQKSSDNIQGLYYDVKQKYNCHMDVHQNPEILEEGGQRTWTAILYLNEPEGGGGTKFCDIDVTVQPKKGMVLIWNNLNGDGTVNPASRHAGMPVQAGKKYCIVKWFKERDNNPCVQFTHWPTLQAKRYPVDLFNV